MCCQKLSDFLTFNKCCCGIPLKMATYITGGLMLMYCTFMEIETIQSIYIYNTRYQDYNETSVVLNQDVQGLIIGLGTGVVDYAMRSQDGFEMTMGYLQNFTHGLLIAWVVINGFLIISTCLMLYGNSKGKSMLLLQWLIVIATIGIGNLADIIISIIHITRIRHYVSSSSNPDTLYLIFIIHCIIETVAIFFAFLVVRSYYRRLTLPSIPVSFNTLMDQDLQSNTEEEEETATKDSFVDIQQNDRST